MPFRTLVTGGSGFMGYHLAASLVRDGHAVDLLDNFSRGVGDADLEALLARPNVRLIRMDVSDVATSGELGTDYDYIYHMAAIIGVANVLKRPFDVLSQNVEMLLAMLEFAKRNRGLKRFLFPSTSEVYAGTLQYFTLPVPTPESTPLAVTDLGHPRTSYMLSKIYGEALCRQSGLPVTIIRPHNVYGPRMGLSHVIPELLQRAYDAPDGGSLDVYSMDHSRTFCYVDDAVEQIRRAAELPQCEGLTLNIGTQTPEITIGELADVILRVVGAHTGKTLSLVGQPATSGSVVRRCPDMTETSRATGYTSTVGLETGVQSTFDWYRDRIFEQHGLSAV